MKQLQEEFLNGMESDLEQQLKEVIAVFQNLSGEELLRPGPNNGWSVAECFAHLISYADFYHPRIARALEKASTITGSAEYRHSFLGRYFIQSMNPDGSTKKFKALKKHLPGTIADPSITVSTFIERLENLLSLLRAARHKALQKNSVATSVAPLFRINLGDALAFLIMHNRRHLRQARRVLTMK